MTCARRLKSLRRKHRCLTCPREAARRAEKRARRHAAKCVRTRVVICFHRCTCMYVLLCIPGCVLCVCPSAQARALLLAWSSAVTCVRRTGRKRKINSNGSDGKPSPLFPTPTHTLICLATHWLCALTAPHRMSRHRKRNRRAPRVPSAGGRPLRLAAVEGGPGSGATRSDTASTPSTRL